jgi:hypothetical protein
MMVDMKTMKAKFYKDRKGIKADAELNLVRDKMNDRCRCASSTKGYREQFNIKHAVESGFPKHKGEFGFRWKAVKNNRCQPSIR